MTTTQIIILIALAFLVGIIVGLFISNFNRNRFLIKHGISPQKLDNAIDRNQLPLTDLAISIKETNK